MKQAEHGTIALEKELEMQAVNRLLEKLEASDYDLVTVDTGLELVSISRRALIKGLTRTGADVVSSRSKIDSVRPSAPDSPGGGPDAG